jgi:hypothetical protein
MKRFFIAVAALAVLASSEAQAQQRYYYRSNYARPSYNRPQGPLGRLMEMERAKNAWLRQTFMGR